MNLIAFALLIVSSICIGGMAECRKAFQVKNGTGIYTTVAFSAFNSAAAGLICLLFVRQYSFSGTRLVFSVLYAAIVVLVSSLCLIGSAWGNVTILIASAYLGNLVFPSVYGLIRYPQENKLTPIKILGFMFAFVCLAILFIDSKKAKKQKNIKFTLCCLLAFLAQGSALIIFKMINHRFGTEQYFNFMAEYMFLSAVLLCPILLLMVKKSVKNNERPKVFKKENIFFISSYAILFVLSEFLALKCVSLVPLTFQAPISFCIPIIVTAVLERILYKIKIEKKEYIQLTAAIASCICFVIT